MSARVLGGTARSTEGWTDDLNFEACDAVIDSRVTSSGGANRTRINGAGVREAAAGAARVNHTPVGRRNHSPNNSWVGAAAGVPGTLPNLWAWFTSTGLNREIVGLGIEGGRRYMDLRIYGTATSGGSLVLYTSQIAALTGQTWTTSMYMRVVAGAASAALAVYLNIAEYTSGGAYVRESFSAPLTLATSGSLANARQSFTSTLSGGGTVANLSAQLYMIVSNGAVVDVTLRLAVQQTERAAAASADIFTFNGAVTVFDTSGLLNEPALVQRITAPNDVSNVAWSKSAMTAPAADTLRETATNAYHYIAQIGAITAGAVCVMYAEVKADGRSGLILQIANGGDALQAGFDLANTAGGYVTTFGVASSAQRGIVALEDGWFGVQVSGIVSPSATLPGAHIFGVDGSFNALYTGDITKGLKVRNVNFGEGRFATSPVLTAATATAAAHYVQGAAFTQYYAAQGTYLVEFTPLALTHNEVYWGIGQPSVFNNSLYLVNSSNRLFLIAYSGGVNTVSLDLGALAIGTRVKAAITYQSGEIAACMNGGAEQVSSGAMPASVGIEGLLTSPWGGGAGGVSAHMHRRRYRPYPSRGQLYQLTA